MNKQEFDKLRGFLKGETGLVLGDDKRYLIDSRLAPVLRQFNISDLAVLIRELDRPGNMRLRTAVAEAMTINESFFFRDMTPFDNFRKLMLPHMLRERASQRRLRIWSAAAATGQEAYSLAMELSEQKARLAGWKIEIIATDISSDALARAKRGVYSQFEVQRGMPSPLLVKYFSQQGSEWAISPQIKSMVSFRHFNLLKDYRALGRFDIVFCRNVLIYFDRETKADILSRIAAQMPDDGFLTLGAAETIVGLSDEFKMVTGARGLYQWTPAQAAAGKRPALRTAIALPPRRAAG